MTEGTTNIGQELERRIVQAYRQMGAYAEHDKDLAGNQIDVYVEWEMPDRTLTRIAVEAKNWASRVGKPIVNDFARIVNLLRSERLIDKGIIVSPVGFTRPARTAAERYGIKLLELADLEMVAQRRARVLSRVSFAPSLNPETLCDQFRIARYALEVYRTLSWENEQSEWEKRVGEIRGLLDSQGRDCGSVAPDDPRFKEVVKLCGIPRWWNVPVIMKLASFDEDDEDERDKARCLYEWLRETPFAVEYSDCGLSYHFDVRRGLQRFIKRRDSLIGWLRLHQELMAFWEQDQIQVEEQGYDAAEVWERRLNVLYHKLCRTAQLPPVLTETCRQLLLDVDADSEKCAYRLKCLSEIIHDANSYHPSNVMEHWAERISDMAGVLEDCNRAEEGKISVDHLTLLEGFWEPLVQENIFNDLSDPQLRRRIWVHIGDLRSERGDDLDTLLDTYQRAGDDFAPAWTGQGKAYIKWGRCQEAMRCFDRAIEIEGPSFEVLVSRGQAHHLYGQWQCSLEDLENAVKLQPDIGWAWLELAQVRQYLEDYVGAQRGFQKAVELGLAVSDEFAAHFGLAEVSERLGDYEAAVDEWSLLIEEFADESVESLAELHIRRANAFSQTGDENMAALDGERAEELMRLESDEGRQDEHSNLD